jgi:hypothetical protein
MNLDEEAQRTSTHMHPRCSKLPNLTHGAGADLGPAEEELRVHHPRALRARLARQVLAGARQVPSDDLVRQDVQDLERAQVRGCLYLAC